MSNTNKDDHTDYQGHRYQTTEKYMKYETPTNMRIMNPNIKNHARYGAFIHQFEYIIKHGAIQNINKILKCNVLTYEDRVYYNKIRALINIYDIEGETKETLKIKIFKHQPDIKSKKFEELFEVAYVQHIHT